LKKAKHLFYNLKIKKLRKGNPKEWHRQLKKLTRFDQHQDDELTVENIKDFTNDEQVELIADKFAKVANEYDQPEKENIDIPAFTEEEIPVISEQDVEETIAALDVTKSNVEGDVPAKILNYFAKQLAMPVRHVIDASIRQGCWPTILKLEIVTPVAKVFPPKSIDQLRNIKSGQNSRIFF
jgi:hypothetical protein